MPFSRALTVCMLVAAGVVVPAAAALPQRPPPGPIPPPPSVPTSPYEWPVRPFDAPHAIRGGFDDPRIGRRGSVSFHWGIDIPAAGGTPVYAVRPGIVYLRKRNAVGVRPSPGRAFDYWHITPVVRRWQRVALHQLLGYVDPGSAHLHFTEIERGSFVNPTRPGALEPTSDHLPPVIGAVFASAGGQVVDPLRFGGRFDLVADVHDRMDLRPPPPWSDALLAPALVAWRLEAHERPLSSWHVAVDFRTFRPPAADFHRIYAPGTEPNRPGRPSRYLYYLARGLTSRDLAGASALVVLARDSAGNTTLKRLGLAEPAAARAAARAVEGVQRAGVREPNCCDQRAVSP